LGREDEDIDPAKTSEVLASRIQEERRLMYVGITRARRSLHLSWCQSRRRGRDKVIREPSRFIEEMGLGGPATQQDQAPEASPRARLDRLKALLNKSVS